MKWVAVSANQWILIGDHGGQRAINRVGPYFNEPTEKYVLTGPDYEATEYLSFEEAWAAAEDFLLGD